MPDVSVDRKKKIKELIKLLHAGKKPEQIKEEFKDVLRTISPTEIAQIEEELIIEGMPREQIRKLCDVHLAVFEESLEKPKAEVKLGHSIRTFMEEHRIILQFLEKLKNIVQKVNAAKSFDEIRHETDELKKIAENLIEIEKHNVREENVLFPHLEKHGISEPPAIMWAEHNELRDKKKKLMELTKSIDGLGFKQFQKQLAETAGYIIDELAGHIYKEDNILYPAALATTTEEEWKDIKEQCDELGYCSFTPEYAIVSLEEAKKPAITPEGLLAFETGNLSKQEIEAIFNTLPVDITFVDANDAVRYFSKAKGRIFPRAKAIIGRKVQQCHPQQSIHIVNRVVDDLRNGRRASADFWIDTRDGKKIFIRYFPVRNEKGEYLGVLEVSQDITEIQKLKGERRLFDDKPSV